MTRPAGERRLGELRLLWRLAVERADGLVAVPAGARPAAGARALAAAGVVAPSALPWTRTPPVRRPPALAASADWGVLDTCVAQSTWTRCLRRRSVAGTMRSCWVRSRRGCARWCTARWRHGWAAARPSPRAPTSEAEGCGWGRTFHTAGTDGSRRQCCFGAACRCSCTGRTGQQRQLATAGVRRLSSQCHSDECIGCGHRGGFG
eukprot:SAG11_NODE_252_length_11593_cov_7.436663_10_plen_205_part_00